MKITTLAIGVSLAALTLTGCPAPKKSSPTAGTTPGQAKTDSAAPEAPKTDAAAPSSAPAKSE